MTDLVLSLFPGIGLLDMAFEQEGFCVVRGPDLLWGGDIKRFHPPAGKFDGVIGGPPCQAFSRLQSMVKHNRSKEPPGSERYKQAENLIPEFERCITEAQPLWFLMENVPAAPEPVVAEYSTHAQLLNNRWCGGAQNRVRRITFGIRMHDADRPGSHLSIPGEALEPADHVPTCTASGSTWVPVRLGGSGKNKKGRIWGDKSVRYLEQSIQAQGLPNGWTLPGYTVRGAISAVNNGVPLPMGRAVARAVRAALGRRPVGG